MLMDWVNGIDALKRLRLDKSGVVSFEYLIIGAFVIGLVGAVFNSGASPIKNALTSAMNTIGTAVTTAVGS
jgi:Flp pilus assembly pilin Flp